jgi:hypothetical protein
LHRQHLLRRRSVDSFKHAELFFLRLCRVQALRALSTRMKTISPSAAVVSAWPTC